MKQQGSKTSVKSDERKRSSGVVLSFLVLSFTAFAAVSWQERQPIVDVHAAGTTGLSDAAVGVVLDSCRSVQRRTIDLAHVRDQLECIPFVNKAHVYFDGVRSLKAEIDERCPVAHVVLPDGSIRYLDMQGTILPEAVVRTAHDVPLVRKANGAQLTQAERTTAARMLVAARERLSTNLYEAVSEVMVGSNSVVMQTLFGSWKMELPKGISAKGSSSVNNAFEDLNVFAERTGMRSGTIVNLDLRWNKHVVVKRVS